MNINPKVQICMFVYNLENSLEASIKSVLKAAQELNFKLYIMCNGCADNSYSVASKFTESDERIYLLNLEFGDKSETWNRFVYEHYYNDSIPVFLDGDLTFKDASIHNLVKYQIDHPTYNSVSGIPWDGGRGAKSWQQSLVEGHHFTGNLYTLSPQFLLEVKSKNVRLPIGLIGDDSMLGYLTATNIADKSDEPILRRGVCLDAIFMYEKLNPLKLADIRLYFRRKVRYAMRALQQNSIVPLLKKDGISAMPGHASDVFKNDLKKLDVSITDSLFMYLAKKKIKREISN